MSPPLLWVPVRASDASISQSSSFLRDSLSKLFYPYYMSNPTTWEQLAKELGITRSTLRFWRRKPDAPQTRVVDDWKAWQSAQMPRQGRNTAGEADDMATLRKELLKAQAARERANARLREMEIESREKSLVPQSEVSETIIKTLTPLRRLLDALPRHVSLIANPENPNIAEIAVRNALDERVFAEIQKILLETEN